MDVAIMFILMFALLLIGVPIGVSLCLPMFVLVAMNPVTTNQFIVQQMYTGVASFTMLAIPFFMVSGSIMETGGLSKRLVSVANACVGGITGNLGIVTILGCMFFGAVSGSAPATVAAIGAIMIPQMVKAGYDRYYATGLACVAGGLGVIVPPSYPMVIYGVTNNISIGRLFIGGIGPSILVGGILMLINYVYAKKRGYKGTSKFSFKGLLKAVWNAKAALLMPVIILGGIYGGFFTATEAAVVATVYGIIVGLFIYKELKLKDIWSMFKSNANFMGGMMLTMAPAAAMGSIFAYLGVTESIGNFFFSISDSPYIIILLMTVLLFLVGMFVQTTPAIVILSPILLSVATQVGIDPVHFGLFMTLALAIAFVTPPVAVNLFVGSSMTGLDMVSIAKKVWAFIVGLVVALLLVGFFPFFTMFFVRLFGG